MMTVEELTKKKRTRLRVINATAGGERRARRKYPILGDERIKEMKRENRRVAKLIVGYMDQMRSGGKVFA